MKSRMIVCSAVLLTATVAGAQDRVAQEQAAQERVATVRIAERHATEAQAMTQAQAGGRGGAAARVPLESKIVKGAPYSAEVVTESTQVLADGNRIVHRATGRVYRDSLGRTRRENDREPGRVASISISDPVAQTAYSLDAETKTAWKTGAAIAGALVGVAGMKVAAPVDPAELERRQKVETEMVAAARSVEATKGGGGTYTVTAQRQRMPGWDEKTEALPAKNIEGVMAEGTRTTRTIPAGAIGNEQPIVSVTEEWRSAELQVLVLTRTSDPRSGESIYRLQNITRAEPNSSWFEVPADYTLKESGVRKLTPAIK